MSSTAFYINQAKLDSFGNIWCVGRDLVKYNGADVSYYSGSDSAVPDNSPYYLDTRSISIDSDDTKWVGCAVSESLNQTIIFSADGINAATGSSWQLSGFGNLLSESPNWEVPTIYASPYCSDVLAFISPLNGTLGTGATGISSITGGYLWRYDKKSETWNEVAPGYTWPHIYEITARCESEGFNYYLATDDGLQIIPDGHLDLQTMADGSQLIPTLKKLNSNNSGIGSDIIYSISFDECGKYWAGTQEGLVYWDNEKFYNWTAGDGNGITKVQARKNGHVFFRRGNPLDVPTTTNGLYHFNGDTFTLYNSATSSLPNDRIIDIMLSNEKSQRGDLTVYENNLWLISGNSIALFDYVIPHVYGTSNYEGATGWNFVYYEPTITGSTGDKAKLPKAGKYTWTTPTWLDYDAEKIALQHPGLDPRNMFLDVNFKDLINKSAGNQEYWNNGEVIPYAEMELNKLIPDYTWLNNTSDFTITSTARYRDMNVVTGYSTSSVITLGEQNSLVTDYTIENVNPTATVGTNNIGFIAFFNDGGQVRGAIPLRGYDTKALKVASSLDDSSLFILGSYSGYIEAGKFVYGSEYPGASSMTVTGITGPTGGPIGFSNLATPGLTASYDYPWIQNGPTSATGGIYLPDMSVVTDTVSLFIAEIDFDLGNEISYGGIDFVSNEFASKFCLKNFRYFPGASSGNDPDNIISGISGPYEFGACDLSVAKNTIRLTSNFRGGISTLSSEYENSNDFNGVNSFVFSTPLDDLSSYNRSGMVIDLNSSLNIRKAFTIGMTGVNTSSLDNVNSLSSGFTYLLTGTSTYDVSNGDFTLSHPNPGFSNAYFILNDDSNNGITGAFLVNSGLTGAGYNNWYNTIRGYKSKNQYYADVLFTGESIIVPTPNDGSVASGSTGALNIATISINPGGYYSLLSTYEVLPDSYVEVYNATISDVTDTTDTNDYYNAIYYPETPGVTGSAHTIIKRNVSGTYIDSFSTFPVDGPTGDQATLKLSVSDDLDIFIVGSNSGATGPSGLPYPGASGNFIGIMESYKALTGKNMGDIRSIAGSGAWVWADVHNSDSDLYVPILSTVFMSNYNSEIFGKNNNRWVLSDASNGEILLDVKNVPYFIYTFTKDGYYSIINSIEDSRGNIYETSKPAFITVVNQSIASAEDPNPEYVNSVDYGYVELANNRNSKMADLQRDLLAQQRIIMDENKITFSSGIVIDDNPNDTFAGN